jgi:hypothetical protein
MMVPLLPMTMASCATDPSRPRGDPMMAMESPSREDEARLPLLPSSPSEPASDS